MPKAARYRLRFAADRRYADYALIGPFLARMLVPDLALAWIGGDAELSVAWIATLAGDAERGGALAEIVGEADRRSVAASLGVDAGARAVAPAKAPLHLRLVAALRALIESGELPVNRPGAAAWVFKDDLWLVAKRGIDAMRAALEREGHTDVPQRNDRIMDTLQQHRLCRANGERAVWTASVRMDGFDQPLTLLRLPLAVLWPLADRRPPAMTGEIVEVAATVTGAAEEAASDDQAAAAAAEAVTADAGRPLARHPATAPPPAAAAAAPVDRDDGVGTDNGESGGVSGISCLGHDDGNEGDIVWHDASSLLSRTQCSTSCWPAPMRRPRSTRTACWTS
jgi:hypothetical protein